MIAEWQSTLGARYLGEGRCRFTLWAPRADQVHVRLLGPPERLVDMIRLPASDARGSGLFEIEIDQVFPGDRYTLRLNDALDVPDPASHSQPEGVHGPSAVVGPDFPWTDQDWSSPSIRNYVLYELHVGTYTPEGTFEAIIPHLAGLRDLGITALELMPVNQCPGKRNWGYDGVQLFAVQHAYGGVPGLKKLVDACHREGLAVVLDVVQNHFGPEGNYMEHFAPYQTQRYRTLWGGAINFDGAHSDGVRRFFIENALYWLAEFHIDALRLDATQAIFDHSAKHYLAELAEAAQELIDLTGRRVWLIGESDLNDVKLVRSRELGGYGLDAQWLDDFHHALHTLVTGDLKGYFCDFGQLSQLATAYREGFIYSGQFSEHRQCRHGNSSAQVPPWRFVVHAQNHDQVGNQMGRRLSEMTDWNGIKLAAGATILSPYVPLLFMGEEYGDPAPFHYFVNHSDPELIEAVRKGRAEECAAFGCESMLDPQGEEAFLQSKLNHALKSEGRHRLQWEFYRALLTLRATHPALATLSRDGIEVACLDEERVIAMQRKTEDGSWIRGGGCGDERLLLVFNFESEPRELALAAAPGRWRLIFDSAGPRWEAAAGDARDGEARGGSARDGGAGGAESPEAGLLESDGRLRFSIPLRSFRVYQKEANP